MRGGRAWRYSACVTAMLWLAPWAASAQQAVAPGIVPGARVQEVDLIGQVIYDSDVASSGAALAVARGIRLSDVIFEPKLQFDVARPIGRETVYVSGYAGYDFYTRNSILNRENIDIRPGVLGQIGRCQTGLAGEYSRAQRDLSEIARSPAGLVPSQQRDVLQVEEVGGNATCVGATGFGPSLTASETWTNNSSSIERFVDAQTFSGSGGLTYRRPVLGDIRVFGAFSQTDFPNRAGLSGLGVAAFDTGYQTVSGGVSYTRAVGSRLQGSASISYTKLIERESNRPGFTGATFSAALTYQVSTRLHAVGTVSRSTEPSNRLNSTFEIVELYSGQVFYDLGSRLTVSGGASFTHENYNGVPYPLGFDLTDDKIYAVFGEAEIRLTRRLSMVLDARQSRRNANFPGLSYPDTRVGLTARATF